MIQEHSRDTLKMEINLVSTSGHEMTPCRSDSSSSLILETHDDHVNPESPLSSTTSCQVVKKVTFSTLAIREYGIIPGDNPGVSCGCPLSIGWEYDDEFSFAIDVYEEQRTKPRSMTELRMPSMVREKKLREAGFSRRDIQESTKYANIARLQRRRTTETLNLAPIQEFLERAKRKTLHLVGAGTKRKERELMSRIPVSPMSEKFPLKRDSTLRISAETVPLDASIVSFTADER